MKTREQIRSDMDSMGITITSLARANGWSRDSLSKVLMYNNSGKRGKSYEIAVSLELVEPNKEVPEPLKKAQDNIKSNKAYGRINK